MSRRRDQVLDAALAVLGDSGARGLTYQAVDSWAGVPPGTASNYFRNRAALLRGALAHLLDTDRSTWERFAKRAPTSIDGLVRALSEMAAESIGPGRTRTRARYVLFLEAMTRPDLAEMLAEGRGVVLTWAAQWMDHFGLSEPRQRSKRLLGYLDGVTFHQLAFPDQDFDPAPGFRALLAEEPSG